MPKYKYDDDNIPTFEIVLSDDDTSQGIRFISLVTDPAIDVFGMAFSKDKSYEHQFKSLPDQQMIVGPTMIPYKKINRIDKATQQKYYAIFTPETIMKIVDRFNSGNNSKSINIDHSNRMVPGYIQQNWIVSDPVYDKSKYYGYNLQIGSHFAEIKITDKQFWEEQVKEGGRYSFSIEGMFGQTAYQFSSDELLEIEMNAIIDQLSEQEILDILNSLKN
jgi:hypothetical protein